MTEPQPVMDQAEQDQLTRQVGRALLTVAEEGWTQVRAEYRSAGRHVEVDVFVTGTDGTPRPVRPPVDVVEGLGKLRQGMYRPGRGTWLSAMYLLEPPSSFSAEFEPDVEPKWRRLPPPIGFADELRFYPRADEHIPGWLRQRTSMPPAGDQPPTPPGGFQQPTPDQPGQHSAQPGHPAPGGPAYGGSGPASGGSAPGGPRYGDSGPGGVDQPGHPAAPIPMQSGQPGGPPPGQPRPPRPDFPPPGPAHPYQPGPHQPGPPPNGASMSFQQPGGQFSQPAW